MKIVNSTKYYPFEEIRKVTIQIPPMRIIIIDDYILGDDFETN